MDTVLQIKTFCSQDSGLSAWLSDTVSDQQLGPGLQIITDVHNIQKYHFSRFESAVKPNTIFLETPINETWSSFQLDQLNWVASIAAAEWSLAFLWITRISFIDNPAWLV